MPVTSAPSTSITVACCAVGREAAFAVPADVTRGYGHHVDPGPHIRVELDRVHPVEDVETEGTTLAWLSDPNRGPQQC